MTNAQEAYEKAKIVIKSCKSKPQITSARQYLDNFIKIYPDQLEYISVLETFHKEQSIFISPFQASTEMMLLLR